MENVFRNLHLLSFDEQISEINFAIDRMLKVNSNIEIKESIDRKYSAINHLKALSSKIIKDKGIIEFLYTLFISITSMTLNLEQKCNEKNKPKII